MIVWKTFETQIRTRLRTSRTQSPVRAIKCFIRFSSKIFCDLIWELLSTASAESQRISCSLSRNLLLNFIWRLVTICSSICVWSKTSAVCTQTILISGSISVNRLRNDSQIQYEFLVNNSLAILIVGKSFLRLKSDRRIKTIRYLFLESKSDNWLAKIQGYSRDIFTKNEHKLFGSSNTSSLLESFLTKHEIMAFNMYSMTDSFRALIKSDVNFW